MTTETMDCEKIISASRLRMRIKSPFFATLALFAEFKATDKIETAATDGKIIFYNGDFLLSLPSQQQDGLILHEILHCALLHNLRRKHRDGTLWNIAADIVVNGLIAEDGNYQLPPKGIRCQEWENKSVEEIYELLFQESEHKFNLSIVDLLISSPSVDNRENSQDSMAQHREVDLKAYWQNALQQATIVARTANQGKLPAGIERQLEELQDAQIDWRTYLWRFLVQTPTDFQGFDRRFIGEGLYLDALVGESLQVFVAIDTSVSISQEQMNLFCSELRGILRVYPHIDCQLYYADADIYGPYQLKADDEIPQPVGGGGTSFCPFFQEVAKTQNLTLQGVCIYLTDGYGDFPTSIPTLPILWVVVPGGLEKTQFPFGEVVKLI